MIVAIPFYLPELKSVLIPAPVYCESSTCAGCGTGMVRSEFPMTFYDDYCSDACSDAHSERTQSVESCEEILSMGAVELREIEDLTDEELEQELDEDAMNAYIDYVLNNDYDW